MPSTNITVVIPAYNCGKYLPAALSSALRVPAAEIIVAEHGSQDDTRQVASHWRDLHPGRIRLLDNPGYLPVVGVNLNRAFRQVRTPFAVRLDGDDILWPLLGLESASDGGANTISLLSGEHGWHTLGLAFTASTQTSTYCQSQDLYTPSANGIAAFEEDNYGAVAVQGMGSHGQRTFVMSYTIKCLTDAAFPSTKAELLNRILAFFFSPELTLPEISGLEIAKAGADSIRLSWEYPFPVDHFSVLGGDTPAGVASEDMQVQETEAVLPTQPYRFYQVKACKAFGM